MDDKLCELKHKTIEDKFNRHESWLCEHEEKIDKLSKSDATNTNEIKNLCKNISDLVATIKWLIGIMVTIMGSSLVGFFIWYVQNIKK